VAFIPTLADLDALAGRLCQSWAGDQGRIDGLSRLSLELYERTAKCYGEPPPRTAPIPRAASCDPYQYNDADHFEASVRTLADRRKIDGFRVERRYHTRHLTVDEEVLRPRHVPHRDDPTAIASSLAFFARVREAIEAEFDLGPQARHQSEIRIALLAYLGDLEQDPADDPSLAFSRTLASCHPELFGVAGDTRQRNQRKKARERAVRRTFEWLARTFSDDELDVGLEGPPGGDGLARGSVAGAP
jgi:hypothetical protein